MEDVHRDIYRAEVILLIGSSSVDSSGWSDEFEFGSYQPHDRTITLNNFLELTPLCLPPTVIVSVLWWMKHDEIRDYILKRKKKKLSNMVEKARLGRVLKDLH